MNEDELQAIRVHRGITFSGSSQKHYNDDPRLLVCHNLLPGQSDNFWWLGFDCDHDGDICPAFLHMKTYGSFETYKNMEYVKNEVEFLAQKLYIYMS